MPEFWKPKRLQAEAGARLKKADSLPTQTSVPEGDGSTPSGRRLDETPARFRRWDTSTDARFLPGTVVAGRYRVVGLLGRGGMGEVYRADDLKLGQPVALKFLPEHLEQDESRLERFLNEVRVARHVSHPNVCRVFDIGEIAGQHFLSMEYVDGEDLSSLLRRIGRLPHDKSVEIARQLCAGLFAAHARGVVHRDLKPSNVMVDGEGQVRITDFGLSGLADGFEGSEIRVGTPAYMSPEQLCGREVSLRSDLYSLGLVLYELFTGKQAFEAETLAELTQRQQESTPTNPSVLVPGLDPAVERVIMRCLEKDPELRPGSALDVSAALPGGDPLAAALAAGETPSPAMVAAAGPQVGLRPGVAAACLAVAVVGLFVLAVLLGRSTLYGRVPIDRPIAALADDARQIIRDLGYEEPPVDSVCRFMPHRVALEYFAEQDTSARRWDPLSRPGQIGIYFFYRQSERPMAPDNLAGTVGFVDPYPGPGNVIVSMGLQGRLLRFAATPPIVDHSAEPAEPRDWSVFFEAAGLDMAEFEPIEPTMQPPVFADTRAAWSGVLPHRDDLPVRVEAATLRGRPVFFETVTPYDAYWSEETAAARAPSPVDRSFQTAFLALAVLVAAGAIFLTLRNRRLGRGDAKGALRLALYVFGLSLLHWIAVGHHVGDLGAEAGMFLVALGNAASLALLSWVLYMAVEPYARRLWPEALVSWSRLLGGRIRDPLVGRDLLIGVVFGVGLLALENLGGLAPAWIGLPPPAPFGWGMDALAGGRLAFGQVFLVLLVSLAVPLSHFTMFLLLRIVLRRPWLAAGAYCAIVAVFSAFEVGFLGNTGASPALIAFGGATGLVIGLLILTLLLRFGLLAAVGCFLLVNLLVAFPVSLDSSDPYFSTSVFGLFLAVLLAGAAFYVSLAGRPMFNDSLLDG